VTLLAESGLVGAQRPRICSIPPFVSSAGAEAVDLAASAGLVLDPWQAWLLEQALGEKPNGRWSAFEVGLIVSRQNGKGSILEARELAGLFLLGEQLILHSAHEFKTAQEAFRRIKFLIESAPHLDREVMRVRTSHGEEGIELRNGARLRFVARSTGSGRGFTGDCVILDEAFNLDDTAMSALLPTLSARPNPQLWYTSSAGTEMSVQLGRVRRRGVKGTDPGLAFFEWSVPDDTDPEAYADPDLWAAANPALGIRISVEHIARERAAMSAAAFGQERLGVGSYPSDEDGWAVISEKAWRAVLDPDSAPVEPFAFALDTMPGRAFSSIGLAGRRDDGGLHVEVAAHGRGTGWTVPWLVERCERWSPCAVVVDPNSPAGSLIPDLEAAGIEVLKPSGRDLGQACGAFFDAVQPAEGVAILRHRDDPRLDAALAGARRRDLGDGAWTWSRRATSVDISPLVAVTLAAWGHASTAHEWSGDYDALANIW
jgi:hypothetical protein